MTEFFNNSKGGDTLSRLEGDSAPPSPDLAGRTRTASKKWTDNEIKIIKSMYPSEPMKNILGVLPGRTKSAVINKALVLKIKRHTRFAQNIWNQDDLDFLRREYATMPFSKLCEKLNRSQNAISMKAERIGLRRYKEPAPGSLTLLKQVDPLIILLRDARRKQKLTQKALSKKAGFHRNTIATWERGINQPRVVDLRSWAEALGRDITLADDVIKFPPREIMLKRWMAGR